MPPSTVTGIRVTAASANHALGRHESSSDWQLARRAHRTGDELRSFFRGFSEMTCAGPPSFQPHTSGCGFDGTTPIRAVQHHGGSCRGSARREKIYCDKWIHDGTCAFIQQGCKYKHEMPHDRETQERLGLFHGYPAWWKKQAIEQQRPLCIDDRPVNIPASCTGLSALGSSASMGSGLSGAVVSSVVPLFPAKALALAAAPDCAAPTGPREGLWLSSVRLSLCRRHAHQSDAVIS